MKHFRIDFEVGHSTFSTECDTIAEAWDALQDLASATPVSRIRENADDYIEMLVKMKNGEISVHRAHCLAISCFTKEET